MVDAVLSAKHWGSASSSSLEANKMAVSLSPVFSPLHANTGSFNLCLSSPKLLWVGSTSRPTITRTGFLVLARSTLLYCDFACMSSLRVIFITRISWQSLCFVPSLSWCCLPESGSGLTSEDKRELLERYGLNPDEFLSDPSPKKVRACVGARVRLELSNVHSVPVVTTDM